MKHVTPIFNADERLMYQLGKRDTVAETLMLVRLKGEREALRDIAEQLIKSDEECPNPHAKWYLENHLENPRDTPLTT